MARESVRRVLILVVLLAICGPVAARAGEQVLTSQPVDTDLLRDFKVDYNNAEGDVRAVFDKYIEALGATAILDSLEEAFPRCHHQAHDLGAVLYSSLQDLALSLEICGERCTGACMHGVIREAFGSKTLADVQGALTSFCEEGVMSGLHKRGNCAHALGQAVMLASGQELGKALEVCSTYADPAMGYYCATGVYTEYFTDPETLDLEVLLNLHFPCDTYDYPAACYRYKSPLMLRALKGDGEAMTTECLGLSGARRRGCFHGLGMAQLPVVFESPGKLVQVCGQGTSKDQTLCIEGVVEKLADYDEDLARRACESLEGKPAKVCMAAAEDKMYRMKKASLPLYLGK